MRLVAISNPVTNSASCGNTMARILVKNNGANTINSMTLSYTVDGGSAIAYNWNGTLLSTETTIINLPEMVLATGAHTLDVNVGISNDANITNNDKSVYFFCKYLRRI